MPTWTVLIFVPFTDFLLPAYAELITEQHLFIAQPPLYRSKPTRGTVDYSDQERDVA